MNELNLKILQYLYDIGIREGKRQNTGFIADCFDKNTIKAHFNTNSNEEIEKTFKELEEKEMISTNGWGIIIAEKGCELIYEIETKNQIGF